MVRTVTGEFSWIKALFFAFTGGLLAWAAFPNLSWWWVAPLSIAVLLRSLKNSRTSAAFIIGLVWGMTFLLPHLWWASISLNSLVPWFFAVLVEASFVAAWTATVTAVPQRIPQLNVLGAQLVFLSITWVGMEEIRSSWPWGGFPWGLMALSQVDSPLHTLIPYLGQAGISALVVILGILIYQFFTPLVTWQRRTVLAVSLGLLLTAPLLITLPGAPEQGTIRIGAVQGNVAQPVDEAFGRRLEVTGNHIRETRTMLERTGSVDLIVWGETAADRDPRREKEAQELLDSLADITEAPILVGANRYEIHAGEMARWNDYLVWKVGEGAVSDDSALYSKQHPVPFGEYVPWRSVLKHLSAEVERLQVDLRAGERPAFLDITLSENNSVRVATPICFEVAYPSIVNEAVREGAEILIVPTNNSSFGNTAESTQQLAITRFRALETSRAAVQVSTNGVSGIVLPDGSLIAQSELFSEDGLVAELPLRATLTPATKIGVIPAEICKIFSIFTALGAATTAVYKRIIRKRKGNE